MTEITNLADLIVNAREISGRTDFNEYVNTRPFEKAVKALASCTQLDRELAESIENYIKENVINERELCFVLFTTVYTIYRKNKTANVYEFIGRSRTRGLRFLQNCARKRYRYFR